MCVLFLFYFGDAAWNFIVSLSIHMTLDSLLNDKDMCGGPIVALKIDFSLNLY